MLQEGIICPYAPPLHFVPTLDNKGFLLCVNFHTNVSTVPDRYPVSHLHNFALWLCRSHIFSKIDLVKTYFQIPVAEENIHKTSVTILFRLYEFIRMLFTIRNVGQSFQGLIEQVFSGLPFVYRRYPHCKEE